MTPSSSRALASVQPLPLLSKAITRTPSQAKSSYCNLKNSPPFGHSKLRTHTVTSQSAILFSHLIELNNAPPLLMQHSCPQGAAHQTACRRGVETENNRICDCPRESSSTYRMSSVSTMRKNLNPLSCSLKSTPWVSWVGSLNLCVALY